MMKKLSVLVMLLAISAVASAATVALQAPAQVDPGSIVTINLFSDTAVGDFTVVSISDGGAGGVASNLVVNAGFDWAIFTGPGTPNEGGMLVKNATGKTNFGSPAVSGILYSFDYEVTAAAGTMIQIMADGNAGGTPIECATMEVIPEPMTLALLGLGGLFIRRRK